MIIVFIRLLFRSSRESKTTNPISVIKLFMQHYVPSDAISHLLTKTAINAFGHVDVITRRSSRSVRARLGLDGDGLVVVGKRRGRGRRKRRRRRKRNGMRWEWEEGDEEKGKEEEEIEEVED